MTFDSLVVFKKERPGAFSSSDIACGAVGTAASLSSGLAIMRAAESFIQAWDLKGFESQSYFHLYDYIGKASPALLRGILKSLAVVYVVLLVPIIEEWFFPRSDV